MTSNCIIRLRPQDIGRQSDDDGQNKLIQITDCKESLSCIINRMNLNTA